MHDRPFDWEQDDVDDSTYDYPTAQRMFGWPKPPEFSLDVTGAYIEKGLRDLEAFLAAR